MKTELSPDLATSSKSWAVRLQDPSCLPSSGRVVAKLEIVTLGRACGRKTAFAETGSKTGAHLGDYSP